MSTHNLYILKAEDLNVDAFESQQIEMMNTILTGVKDSILSKTDDFERWDTSTPDVLNKILEEVQLGTVFEGSKLHQTLLNRPEIFWALLRLSDSLEGLEYFFKIMGVSEGLQTSLPVKSSRFYAQRQDLEELQSCNLSIDIDSDTITDNASLVAKIEAINIYNILKMGVCIEYDIKLKLYSVIRPFTTFVGVEEVYQFDTPMIQHDKIAKGSVVGATTTYIDKGVSFKTPVLTRV